MASGRQTTGFGASTASGSHNIPSDLPIGEQLMHVDQAITLTLQEIDANFAQAHQIVTGRILPAVKRYGVASARTWQGARFWKHFFEVSAARLLDEDEGGLGEVQEDEEDEPADLGTGLSRIALTHGADGVDKLLLPADDEESDSDSLSSSEESDGAPTAAGGRQAGGVTGDPSGQYSVSGWTASSMASSGSSRARTIDQDTLFGIRPPAQGQGASGTASASGAGRTNHSSTASSKRGEAKAEHEGFRPWGQVEEQGTVHGGRGLLDERDNTYSAPSPTPAARD
ncbi:dash complex subunit ask1 [Ceraceosorus bombacis]|uniref:DASH complex subunit ASK1 n=1 Tax=Ceraceosorus bombacis TaxID=401625 RepID=A0A0P1BIQ0_9BASI|nr:dash complex subunit ask1 [Ceraceosorus bombacis]